MLYSVHAQAYELTKLPNVSGCTMHMSTMVHVTYACALPHKIIGPRNSKRPVFSGLQLQVSFQPHQKEARLNLLSSRVGKAPLQS